PLATGLPSPADRRRSHCVEPNPFGGSDVARTRSGLISAGNDRRRTLPSRTDRPLGTRARSAQRLRTYRNHHLRLDQLTAERRTGRGADRLTGARGGAVCARRVLT